MNHSSWAIKNRDNFVKFHSNFSFHLKEFCNRLSTNNTLFESIDLIIITFIDKCDLCLALARDQMHVVVYVLEETAERTNTNRRLQHRQHSLSLSLAHDYCCSCCHTTNQFIYFQQQQQPTPNRQINRRLTDWLLTTKRTCARVCVATAVATCLLLLVYSTAIRAADAVRGLLDLLHIDDDEFDNDVMICAGRNRLFVPAVGSVRRSACCDYRCWS